MIFCIFHSVALFGKFSQCVFYDNCFFNIFQETRMPVNVHTISGSAGERNSPTQMVSHSINFGNFVLWTFLIFFRKPENLSSQGSAKMHRRNSGSAARWKRSVGCSSMHLWFHLVSFVIFALFTVILVNYRAGFHLQNKETDAHFSVTKWETVASLVMSRVACS